jgi:hypothetical protein
MSKSPKLTAWSKKKPSMIGEYNASTMRDPGSLRWWNGSKWSIFYNAGMSENIRRHRRRNIASSSEQPRIEWRGMAEKPENFVEPQPLGKL